MRFDAAIKNNCVTIMAFIWGFGIIVLPFLRLMSDFDTVKSVWPGIIILYLAYKQNNKPRGKAKLSLLSIFYFLVGLIILVTGVAEVLENNNFVYILLIIVGIGHFYLGRWAYQNLDESQDIDLFPGLSQTEINYEVINFDKVSELLNKVNAGNINALTNGEYKNEISDAVIQAVSEQTLRRTMQKVGLLFTTFEENKTSLIEQHFKELLAELDENSMYQIYPLLASSDDYLDYFYDGNSELQIKVAETLKFLDSNLTTDNLEKPYLENNPCAKYWPIISKYINTNSHLLKST